METVLKVLAGFTLLWLIWYLTGGPLRDTTDPYIRNDSVPVSTSTLRLIK